ncbi:Protein nrdI [Agrobacterium tumefaciens]|uniref:class Ib ribonucleoside-diphosphate reductase assembly flavoprotein NrdI n=1 Tax=Agrobacterium tumefaciens TaxID=358 RepID=UPI001AD9710A|nr:class Ib ribonucleoside-diphosphate reductase assembly flavoprotein NrdI [Agrobacterium tumefaciens]QTK80126.1 Protein nrdI [Agrobacterium tumefaciens]
MSLIVYYSSRSENTHRFLLKLGRRLLRLPLGAEEDVPQVSEPYVLVTPTYGGGGTKGAVPKPVIRFLNEPSNRNLIRGVIAAGNTSFGAAFASAGDIVSRKCAVPFLYRFELLGTEEDVANVKHGLDRFWTR